MPVKHGILALLEEGPSHGYQLKHDFEARTGGSWELNIGQVYTTLQRLERDGLVVEVAGDEPERRTYAITADGGAAVAAWYATPLVATPPPRDELAIKVLLAVASPEADVHAVMQRQRTATFERLQELTRHKRRADPDVDLATVLHLDALILKAEAEVRWLDACEARLAAAPGRADRPDRADRADRGDRGDRGSVDTRSTDHTTDRTDVRDHEGHGHDDRPAPRVHGGRA